MQSNRSERVRAQLSRPSSATAFTTVAVLIAASVGVSALGIFPLTVEKGIYVPPDRSTVPDGGEGLPAKTYSLVKAEPVTLLLKTSRSPSAGAPRLRTAAFPNLMNALSRVPVKAKLQVLLTMLVAETDLAERADLEAKLTALLKLPEEVLVQVLQHPELAEFNKMLNAVFFGDTELWWVELQLAKITVVPVTTTTNRIDVSGKPAFIYDSTAAAHAADGGTPTSGLKTLPQSQPPNPPETEVSTMMMARSVPGGDVTTFSAPASSDMQFSDSSMSAPVADEMRAAPGPDPAPPPDPGPAPALSNAEISVERIGNEPTASPEVFDTGNRFEPDTTPSEPVTSNPAAVNETATPPTPPAAGAEPSGNPENPPNEGGNPGEGDNP